MTTPTVQQGGNPYGVSLFPVSSPSGALFHVQTIEESDWYERRRDQYLQHNHFVNISDLEDMDRLLMFELMVYRWSLWATQGFDYLYARVEENALKNNIREYCLSEDTEILTRRGWMRPENVAPGEEVLTLNPATQLSEWQSIKNLHMFRPSTPLVAIETRELSALATPGHRWIVQRASRQREEGAPLVWRDTDELDRYCYVPTAAQHGSFDAHHKYSDSFVELIAWWWTEGSCSRPGQRGSHDKGFYDGEIAQSQRANPHKVAMIRRALLHECGEPGPLRGRSNNALWNETARGDIVYFNLSRRLVLLLEEWAPDKVVRAEFVTGLTQGQLELFIARSLDADGWKNSGGGWTISQRREDRVKAFQIAAVLAGYQATMTYTASIDMWCMNLSRRSFARPVLRDLRKIDYQGLVWCPEVDNGTWLARRNGKVFYTGNSVEIRQIKAALGIDKVNRDKDKGENFGEYLRNFLIRAKEFGYHRNKQYAFAVTSFWKLHAMVRVYNRTDEQERVELGLTPEKIIEIIEEEILKPFDQMEQDYRKNQAIWVRDPGSAVVPSATPAAAATAVPVAVAVSTTP